MGARNRTVVMVLASIAFYRADVMVELLKRFGQELEIYAGTTTRDATITLVDPSLVPYKKTSVKFLPGLLLQSFPLMSCLRADCLVADLNPRMPSVWGMLLLRRVLRRPTILWGHAWPRLGRASRTSWVRLLLVKCADGVLVYTDSEAEQLRIDLGSSRTQVFAAPNSLYKSDQFGFDGGARKDFLYVGRLVVEKKLDLLLRGFSRVADQVQDGKLVIVGDGPERSELLRLSESLGIREKVVFTGEVSDWSELRVIYSNAVASVSPGYVGLSLIQSISFGVPMLIARQEPHAPEIEAAVEGKNAVFFESDNPNDLAAKLLEIVEKNQVVPSMSISDDARGVYSVEAMASGILLSVNSLLRA